MLKTRRNDVFGTINGAIFFFLVFASSMFYPVGPLPAWLRYLVWISPVTWHVDVLRFTSIGLGRGTVVAAEAAGFTVLSLACLAYAVKCLQSQK
jgi:ABC-type multidrug transport system permease subunit